MKKKSLFLLVASAFLLISSCKKDDKDANLFIENGSVTGTIGGQKSDGSVLNETFAFNKYMGYTEQQYYYLDGATYVVLMDFSADDGSYWNIKFSLPNALSTNPNLVSFGFDYFKRTGNSLFEFNISQQATNTPTFSGFTFDSTTGRVKGKLSIIGAGNSANKTDTVKSNFDITLAKRTF